ncbi:MAG: hypothetical protein ACLGI6_18645 [Gammaproteobacteria bacterium]
MTSSMHAWHRRSAAVIGLFAFFHIINHLVSLGGVEAHLHWMDAARRIYRQPLVEAVLLACVAFQIISGIGFVIRGWKARVGWLSWLQAASGAYLALFLLAHVGAVLYGRVQLHLDTNFYFAAAGLYVPPWAWFFAPYYFLGVLALFTHLGCAACWQVRQRDVRRGALALGTACAAGAAIALLIVLSLAGKIEAVEVPAKYMATYQAGTP